MRIIPRHVLFAIVVCSSVAMAQDDNDERSNRLMPGLIAVYTIDGRSFSRIDDAIALDQHILSDARIGQNSELVVSWSGQLFVRYAGRFTLRPYGSGNVRIHLHSKEFIAATTSKAEWLDPQSIELEHGWHPLEITYRTSGGTPRFGMFWSSDQFATEPITSWFHDSSKSVVDAFERGRRHVFRLGCANCHDFAGARDAQMAPALDKLAGNMRYDWLADYLTTNGHGESTTAPQISIGRAEATAIAATLIRDEASRSADDDLADADRENGKQLFHTVGCLACHAVDNVGTTGPNSGGDLTNVAAKRPPAFFARWLRDPSSVNAHHRMPEFVLSEDEIRDLSGFLGLRQTFPGKEGQPEIQPEGRGAKLIATKNCQACHLLPPSIGPQPSLSPKTRLRADADWDHSCIGQQPAHQPLYDLTNNVAEEIRYFISQSETLKSTATRTTSVSGPDLLMQHNCLACHSRAMNGGLRDTIEQVVAFNDDLKDHISAMTPPSLNSVGDKMHDDAIGRAIRRADDIRRPWKKVRMPKFNMTDDQVNAIVSTLTRQDRVPTLPHSHEELPDSGELFVAGSRLVTSDGFGCTSCHQLGKTKPNEAPAHSLGPDLSLLGNRIREPWFRRWLQNPANIVPRVEMPSVQQPVRGVLSDHLSSQVAAVWHVLNRPGFNPPVPNPVRVVRQSGTVDQKSRADVLTDVMRYNGKALVKPFAIGLPNRHNILLDLEAGRILDWSMGDVARQRTEGKTWFWEWAGQQLLANSCTEDSTIHLIINNQLVAPNRNGQFVTEPHEWRHVRGGLTLKRRLSFTVGDAPISVGMEEEFQPFSDRSGVLRRITFTNLPAESAVQIQLADETKPFVVSGSAVGWESKGGFAVAATATSLVDSEETPMMIADDASICLQSKQSIASLRLEYVSSVHADQYVLPDMAEVATPRPESISVAPGFTAVRLPVGYELMPTGFAWRGDGAMFVTSLKGRVWLLRDTDGDGVEDSAAPFSDELATPFGVQAFDDYIDVINKGGLLRLTDTNGDGRADRVQTIASGWGHTDDYHDWAIGLPFDGENYYASIACQQDDRSEAAAKLRGKVVKFTPRPPSESEPHLFDVRKISGGHRFSVGIARSRIGDLFVSDNQGNYNPYNELNHVRKGLRYGFINKIEKKTIKDPPLTPPGINIPHPWTRSVNGICFLDTPTVNDANDFGPFEGHLIGCEYDTRRLVRMSLQPVGNSFQGAVYPFSYAEPGADNPLLGPVACAVSPRGELYIGEMRDSGWGAGNNTGAILQIRMAWAELPCGIAEVRAVEDGFEIEFTRPVDPVKAKNIDNYAVSSATRVSTPAYGGDDQNRRREVVRSIDVSSDARQAHLRMDALRIGYVYEFHLKKLSADEERFFPAEAYYSLNQQVASTSDP